MKKTIQTGLLTLMAVILFWGCSSESYPGLEYENPDAVQNGETPDGLVGLPIHVYVNEQAAFSLSASSAAREGDVTRGVGPFQIDDDEDIKKKREEGTLTDEEEKRIQLRKDTTTFYIYAFRNKRAENVYDDMAELRNDPDMRWAQVTDQQNRPADVHEDPKRFNCLVDGADYYKGMRANLDDEQVLVMDRPISAPLYWGEYQEISYNFFGYSVGDVNKGDADHIQWGTPHRDRDSVWFENFAIDGSQDLMVGYAPKITKSLFEEGGRYYGMWEDLSEGERSRILSDDRYTSFAAHRNIEPQIDMKHILTRLRFHLKAGDETSSETTIDAVYATTPYKGDFVVAHKDEIVNGKPEVGFVGMWWKDEMGDLYLHDFPKLVEVDNGDGTTKTELEPSKLISELPEEDRTIPWEDRYWTTNPVTGEVIGKVGLGSRDSKPLGDALLVPEAENIIITIVSTYKKYKISDEGEDIPKTFYSHYTLSAKALAGEDQTNTKYWDPEKEKFLFKRSHIYDITLVVYGLQKIEVAASVEGWKQGEDIVIGPDDAYDFTE